MALVIKMNNLLFAIICTPFCIFALVLNIFFIFCLCKPTVGVRVRQPMYLLLAALLGNSSVQQSIAMISVVLSFFPPPDWLLVMNVAIIFQTYCSGFSINAWISIFYYMKIVPQHWKVLVWVKRNIKAIVFAGFSFDQTLLMSALAMGSASYLMPSPTGNLNKTGNTILNGPLYMVSVRMVLAYLICPSFTLSISWGRTFFYLMGHIKRMKQTTGSSSHPQQKNHMRVTVMGIVQSVLFVPTSLYAMIMASLFSTLYETLDSDKRITMTLTSMFNLANVLCLGFSQSVFRIRVISFSKRVKKAFGSVDQR